MVRLTEFSHLHVRRCLVFTSTKLWRLGQCCVYCFIHSADDSSEKVVFSVFVKFWRIHCYHVKRAFSSIL
jgi:hypothetical protein